MDMRDRGQLSTPAVFKEVGVEFHLLSDMGAQIRPD